MPNFLFIVFLSCFYFPAVIVSKRFKAHGRYEELAKSEYSDGLIDLLSIQSINQPDAVFTSLTGIEGAISVTWVTFNESIDQSINQSIDQSIDHSINQSINQSFNQSIYWGYESNNYTYQSIAQSRLWTDPSSIYYNNSHPIHRFMHHAMMTDLKPESTIYYRVGSINQSINQLMRKMIDPYNKMSELEIVNQLVKQSINQSINQSTKKSKLQSSKQASKQAINQAIHGLSSELIFKTLPISRPVNLIIYGDMGVVNAQSMKYITEEINQSTSDMILHLGDYAYDLHTDNGTLGDVFMHNLQPLTSRVPYLGCEGNHDAKYNASHYTNRFWAYNMLGRTSKSQTNWWFSWDYISNGAKVHFVSINTELYYTYVDEFSPPDYKHARALQYEWLISDLSSHQSTSDWLIVYGHRPMYCSDVDSLGDCTSDATLLREGWPGENNGIDDVINQFGVDIYFTAHEHSYERTLPVYNQLIDLKQQNHTYLNPLYVTHIITGSAGCSEELEWFDPVNYPAWSIIRSPTYGYGHMIVYNKTHLYWDQLIDEGKQGKDTLWIIKDKSRKIEDQEELKSE